MAERQNSNPLSTTADSMAELLSQLHTFTLQTFKDDKWHYSQSLDEANRTLPTSDQLSHSLKRLVDDISTNSDDGEGKAIGLEATFQHLLNDIMPALGRSSMTATYYGFVTGTLVFKGYEFALG